jgi:integrase
MPRTSKGPRYYPSRNGWFANLNGERIRLTTGPKKETAQEARDKYQAEQEARKVQIPGDRNTVWWVLNNYINDLQNRVESGDNTQNTLNNHLRAIEPFNQKLGAMLVRDLRPQHVTDWLAEMRRPRRHRTGGHEVKWGDSTAQMARRIINTAFNWAVGEAGLISKNPLARKGRPRGKPVRNRPTENRVPIHDDEYGILLGQAKRRSKKDFYHLLQFLYATGARPVEMSLVKASEWDEARKAFVIKADREAHGRFKLAHLGEDRILYIPDDLVPLARELMTKRPEGPLFRTERGKLYTKSAICARFRTIKMAANRAGTPVRNQITAYSFRHALVTRWIELDRPLAKLCELLNTSEAMVRKHYSHLFQQTETLRQSLNDFARGRAGQPGTPGSAEAS